MDRWQESEHPRHPEGSERGGRFRDKIGGWVGAATAQLTRRAGSSPEREFADRIAGATEAARGKLTGGFIAQTEWLLLRDRDGQEFKVVRKWSESEADGPAEVRASAIGRALGAPVPMVVPAPSPNGSAVYMEFVEGQSAIQAALARERLGHGLSDAVDDLERENATTPGGRLLGLLDLLIGNNDRNAGNWIVGPNGPHGIDHSFHNLGVDSKYEMFNGAPARVWAGWRRTAFSIPLTLIDRTGLPALARNDFDPSDLALMRGRLTAYIASNPPELGEDQARDLMIRFDLIAGMARHG